MFFLCIQERKVLRRREVREADIPRGQKPLLQSQALLCSLAECMKAVSCRATVEKAGFRLQVFQRKR